MMKLPDSKFHLKLPSARLRLALGALAMVLFTMAAAHAEPIHFEQDLYKFKLKTKGLKLLPAKFRVDVAVEDENKKVVKSPFTREVLRETITPDLVAAKLWVDAELEAFDKAMLEGLKSGTLSEKEVDDKVAALNKVYEAIITQLKLEAEKEVKDEWALMQLENGDLSKWNITVAAKLLTNTVLLARAGASVAGSGGVALGVEIVAVVSHSYKIATELKKALVSEKKARKELKVEIEAMQERIAADKAERKLFRELTRGSESKLKKKLDTYRMKRIALRQKLESLSITLDDLLASGVALKGTPNSEKAQKAIEESVNQLLVVIGAKNKARNEGGVLIERGYKVVEEAKLKRTHGTVGNAELGRRAVAAMGKAYEALAVVVDPMDELIDKSIELGVKAGAAAVKEVKKLKLK